MRISINRDRVIALYSDSEGLYGYLYLNDGRLMLLNRTAIDILKYLYESPVEQMELIEKLSRKYGLPKERIHSSVLKFIEKLADLGVVKYED
jgi:hypothetical protein